MSRARRLRACQCTSFCEKTDGHEGWCTLDDSRELERMVRDGEQCVDERVDGTLAHHDIHQGRVARYAGIFRESDAPQDMYRSCDVSDYTLKARSAGDRRNMHAPKLHSWDAISGRKVAGAALLGGALVAGGVRYVSSPDQRVLGRGSAPPRNAPTNSPLISHSASVHGTELMVHPTHAHKTPPRAAGSSAIRRAEVSSDGDDEDAEEVDMRVHAQVRDAPALSAQREREAAASRELLDQCDTLLRKSNTARDALERATISTMIPVAGGSVPEENRTCREWNAAHDVELVPLRDTYNSARSELGRQGCLEHTMDLEGPNITWEGVERQCTVHRAVDLSSFAEKADHIRQSVATMRTYVIPTVDPLTVGGVETALANDGYVVVARFQVGYYRTYISPAVALGKHRYTYQGARIHSYISETREEVLALLNHALKRLARFTTPAFEFCINEGRDDLATQLFDLLPTDTRRAYHERTDGGYASVTFTSEGYRDLTTGQVGFAGL